MQNRLFRFALLGAACFLSVALLMWWTARKEPKFQGHTVVRWLDQLGTDTNKDAWGAVRHFGDTAIPYIITRLGGTARQRLQALMACQALGPKNGAALAPALIRVVDEGGAHAGLAARILVELTGAEHLPVLVRNLQARSVELRSGVLVALGELGPAASAAVPDLLLLLQDSDLGGAVATALGQIRSMPEAVIPELIEAAQSNNPSLKYRSIEALGRFGEAGREALPEIREALSDPVTKVRVAATNAFRLIASQPPRQ